MNGLPAAIWHADLRSVVSDWPDGANGLLTRRGRGRCACRSPSCNSRTGDRPGRRRRRTRVRRPRATGRTLGPWYSSVWAIDSTSAPIVSEGSRDSLQITGTNIGQGRWTRETPSRSLRSTSLIALLQDRTQWVGGSYSRASCSDCRTVLGVRRPESLLSADKDRVPAFTVCSSHGAFR